MRPGGPEPMQSQREDAPLSWTVSALTAAYVVWCALSLSRRIPAFGKLFADLGADVPATTRMVLGICTPAVLWSAAVIIIVLLAIKELMIEALRVRLVISIIVFMATALFAALVTEATFEPLLRLISRINGG